MGFLKYEGQIYPKGLEGVICTITSISAIDGEEGRLIYRGIDIETLAKYSSFEETAYFLIFGKLPTSKELNDFSSELKAARELHPKILEHLKILPPDPHPMDILKLVIAHTALYDPDKNKFDKEANIRKTIRLIAQFPTIVAHYQRVRTNKEIIPSNPSLNHAANFLYMLSGKIPEEEDARIFDIALILHMEHGMNASTFSGLVTASTLADLHSAIVAAIGTLKGPLHGGANEKVLDMLEEIGTPENTEEYIKNALDEKKKVMGFGHRVYKSYDPRAKILKAYAERLSEKYKDTKFIKIAEKIEEIMVKEVGQKGIMPNVDFYSGIVYHFLNIPRDLYTAIFSISRVVGWTSHILEYWEANRIFRPRALYNGPIGVDYIPIEKRG